MAAITFDCANAPTLGEFWSAALDRPIDSGEPAASPFFARIPPGEGSPAIMFIQVPESRT
ncbi:MAG: hypothetical protein GY929_01895 [Actinomycetia bacterium]|nr:hypothetical protein [Actinomycetes bacterium]